MKAQEKKELHTKTINELSKLIKDATTSLAKYKIENAQNKLKNTNSLTDTRRTIAVLRTILREKELIKNV
jgi:ribosomal protein L29